MLRERLEHVQERLQRACRRCGRDPASVTLVCVTKGLPVETLREAVAAGVTDIGENRVQEARLKQLALGSRLKAQGSGLQPLASPARLPGPYLATAGAGSLEPGRASLQPVRWHLIGHLQRNKAKDAVELFSLIHSVDSQGLAAALEQQAAHHGRRVEVLLQVNVSGEATKSGCRPEAAAGLSVAIERCPHLILKGLMTMAPLAPDPEAARPAFRALRELRQQLGRSGWLLSMGMSQDFEVAIEEGADFVRIGSAIFHEEP